jgi:pimeloyl-ACP methyl ester carboxylesterase
MTRQLNHVKTSFGDIAYSERGEGACALFVHGVFLNGHLWRHVVDHLADRRRCIAVDLMAHGATKIDANQDVSFTAQAQMLEAFCESLGLDQIDLIGNDSGGGIAQIFAARHPNRIRSLTLTNCDVHDNWPPKAFEETRNAVAQGRLSELVKALLGNIEFARSRLAIAYQHPERIAEETIYTYFEPFTDPGAVKNLERWFAATNCKHTVAIESLLRKLEAPTLIVWATDDVFFPLQWAYWLRSAIPGARKVVELKDAKLFFPEERPEELANAIRDHWETMERSHAQSAGLAS